MAVTVYADVTGFYVVLPGTSDQRRTDQKTIGIIMYTAAVIVVRTYRLDRIAFCQKVLPEEISDVDVLPPEMKCIQAAVGIFLKLVEIGQIKLRLVI